MQCRCMCVHAKMPMGGGGGGNLQKVGHFNTKARLTVLIIKMK